MTLISEVADEGEESEEEERIEAKGEPSPSLERCKAMLEVVRKDHDRWAVSKMVTDHNHELSPPSSGDAAAPAMEAVFESVDDAKAFYYAYGEKTGFRARTGSNRRSVGNGELIMQRFVCWRGSYLVYRNPDGAARKEKRGPYMKRARRASKNGGDDVEVVEVESPAGKGGPVAGDDWLGEGDECQKEPAAVVPQLDHRSQSHLLRELGVKFSRYTNEERRDVVHKYMMKRNNRQVGQNPCKVLSRKALAERRRRGIGGRFLSANELQASCGQEVMTEIESNSPTEITNEGGEPNVGMMFTNEDKAYELYVKYAGSVGFSVRKGWWDKSARNVSRSRIYVCSREGFRPKNVANEAKKPRPETRTGCPARMAIKMTPSSKYTVTEFVADHNHQLAAPLDIEMLKSQKTLTIALPDRHQSACLILDSYKNYLRSRRSKCMQMGDAGAMMEYLQKMKGDNPSFFYAIQVDEDDQLTNIFWAGTKSMMDYYYFGDVVCFDTTYKANDYGRPFAQFLGVNHHKQIVFFGAALLYDESIESFKWLFETFSTAMCGKQPRTILTDSSTAVTDAIAAVWPDTIHHLCVWHLFQNVAKNLRDVFQSSPSFSHDVGRVVYDYDEDEEQFLSAWRTMLEKYDLKDNECLAKLYEEREKWASVYGREAFCADMKNTLQSENFCSVLKEYLGLDKDLPCFLKRYDELIDERRCAEVQADYHANHYNFRIPPLQLLQQAAHVYTPKIFEMFMMEFEMFVNCMVYSCSAVRTISEYEVTLKEKTKKHFVRFDSRDGTILCTCKKFEFVGIQCCHALKVLEFNNIKELNPRYILTRWRKDVKAGSIRENNGLALDADAASSLSKRYNSLCRILYKISERAAENVDAYAFLEDQSDQLLEQVEQILQTRLLEKPPTNGATKSHPQNPVQNEGAHHDNDSEQQRVSGRKKKKKKDGDAHCLNKRQKGRKGQPDEGEAALVDSVTMDISSLPRDPSTQFFAPNQFMQGPYVPAHQFELGPLQGFHGSSHFNQNALQACPTAPYMHFLQFVGTPNPQLGHQNGEPGHGTIPVWDFL